MRGPPLERPAADRCAFGVINLDKPPGPTSHQVVAWIKDLLSVDRAAHAGTLDPKVTGCLPVLVGDATRVAQALLHGQKRYVGVLELHASAPTTLDETIHTFEGEIYQKPPRKSAVRRRLRTRYIHDLTVLERHDRQILLDVTCASGTYIRKLCHDIGLAAGVGAHMGELRRIGVQPFSDHDLVTMHELADAVFDADNGDSKPLESIVQPAERALSHIPAITIAPSAAASVAHGSPVYAPGVIAAGSTAKLDDLVICETPDGAAVCLGRLVGEPAAETGEVVSLERVLV